MAPHQYCYPKVVPLPPAAEGRALGERPAVFAERPQQAPASAAPVR